MEIDYFKMRTTQFNVDKLLSDDYEYKCEYFEFRFNTLASLYYYYDNAETKINIMETIKLEMQIIDMQGYENKLYEELINKFYTQYENIKTLKEYQDKTTPNKFVKYVRSTPTRYSNGRSKFLIELYENNKVNRQAIPKILKIFKTDYIISNNNLDKYKYWHNLLKNKLNAHINGFDESKLSYNEKIFKNLLSIPHDELDESEWKNFVVYMFKRLSYVLDLYKLPSIPVSEKDNIIKLIEFDLMLGYKAKNCTQEFIDKYMEYAKNSISGLTAKKMLNENLSLSNAVKMVINKEEKLNERKERLLQIFDRLYFLDKKDVEEFKKIYSYEISLFTDDQELTKKLIDRLDEKCNLIIQKRENLEKFGSQKKVEIEIQQ